jgi:hypothetical protein
MRRCPGTLGAVDEANLSADDETIWRAAAESLRTNGATHAEAVEGAALILAAYRRQRAGLASKRGDGKGGAGGAP